jgi:uncharacterized metal-binding protein
MCARLICVKIGNEKKISGVLYSLMTPMRVIKQKTRSSYRFQIAVCSFVHIGNDLNVFVNKCVVVKDILFFETSSCSSPQLSYGDDQD